MASLPCGRRLSLRNQYDTKTPRASAFCCARQTDGAVIRAIRRPSREKPGPARVTKKICSVGFEMSVENFSRNKEFEKFPQRSRSTAGLSLQQVLQTAAKSFLNVALGREGRKPS